MSARTFVAADGVEPARLHAAFGEAFADYLIGPFQLPFAQWPAFLARQGMAPALSRVALADGAPIAFAFVAPRPEGGSWRLATMGAVPAGRGTGAAPALLDDLLVRARAAGVAVAELECFAQNTRALRLYQGRGFAEVDALYGYELSAGGAAVASAGAPSAVGLDDAFAWLDACGCELPMQVTPRALRSAGDLQAWRLGSAQLLFSPGTPSRIQVHSLVDRDDAQQDAAALVAAVVAGHPGHSTHVPQLQRRAVGGAALERLGFRRLPLHQLWLRRAT